METPELQAIKDRAFAILDWRRTEEPPTAEVLECQRKQPIDVLALFMHIDGLTARATKAESRESELRGKVASMLEDFANGCVPVKMEGGIKAPPYWLGVNSERNKGLLWASLKCKELGIEWPIKPIPYAGNLPSDAPTPPPSSPAAAGPPVGAKPISVELKAKLVAAIGQEAADGYLWQVEAPYSEGREPTAEHCCHGHGLESHRKHCQSANCDHTRTAPTTTGEGKEGIERG